MDIKLKKTLRGLNKKLTATLRLVYGDPGYLTTSMAKKMFDIPPRGFISVLARIKDGKGNYLLKKQYDTITGQPKWFHNKDLETSFDSIKKILDIKTEIDEM